MWCTYNNHALQSRNCWYLLRYLLLRDTSCNHLQLTTIASISPFKLKFHARPKNVKLLIQRLTWTHRSWKIIFVQLECLLRQLTSSETKTRLQQWHCAVYCCSCNNTFDLPCRAGPAGRLTHEQHLCFDATLLILTSATLCLLLLFSLRQPCRVWHSLVHQHVVSVTKWQCSGFPLLVTIAEHMDFFRDACWYHHTGPEVNQKFRSKSFVHQQYILCLTCMTC